MASITRPPPVDRATLVSRKRFARRQWRRRWLAWKYVVALVLALALLAGACYAVLFSDALDVESVEVSGVESLSAAEVEAVAAVPTGVPVARVDLEKIESRVGSLAVVKSVVVTRQWPDQLLIEVEERVAIAVVEIGNELRGLDDQGVVFGIVGRSPPGLPRIETSVGTPADALREAAQVVSALPPVLARTVDYLEVETVDQISLLLRDGRIVRWGSAEQSEEKARVLSFLLAEPGPVLDVSVPAQVTIAPR